MNEHPPQMGWQRIEPHPCGGHHDPPLSSDRRLVLWHKKRNHFDDAMHTALWVAEHVPPTLCCTAGFYWINTHPAINHALPSPWDFSGPLAPGSTVRLTVANGSWLWQVVSARSNSCGGWTARWLD